MASSSSSSFSHSSSSPTNKKTTKFSKIQQTLFQKPSSSKATSLAKRQETVFKKAYELSTLCGTDVCVISYGLDGELKTWPEDRKKVEAMARSYKSLDIKKRLKGQVDLRQFLKKINKGDSNTKKKKKVASGSSDKYPDWDPRFNNYSVEQLTLLIQSLERSLTTMQHRLRALAESQKQRQNMHNTNMAHQEQMITTTTAALNHLHQHSNQVPMDLFNQAMYGASSQIPPSASSFNQAQSLAPIPNSLTIYQNPLTMYPNLNVESYLRGLQGTGMSEFPSKNMLPYNNINNNNNNSVNGFPKQFYQNGKVEDYSGYLGLQETGINNMNDYPGLLWAQGIGINGLQNMDMYGYNNSNINTNGLSNQLVQFPTQRAEPVFQYGSINPKF
ncbi:hypothetical protein EUTSA_v10022126mg [Eutrema salsugineum]|uniref:MADS-box domain-containing protein n=1 Tax=Eutrema salsugineum TaxID=72664 RepID=V4LW47_EUTSA|nr:agamous-like MADS-box protein AGL103 [Eutrema salsugineum]ESQ48034.1 hypothetical protein EUTSA_v10022126mg [Eutrema salsugineum]